MTDLTCSLPKLAAQISARVLKVDQKLESLPQPPTGNLSCEIQAKILDFASTIRQQFDGGHSDYLFFTTWHEVAKAFRHDLVNTQPALSLPANASQGAAYRNSDENSSEVTAPGSSTIEIIDLSDNETTLTPSPSKKRTIVAQMKLSPSKRQKMTDIPRHSEKGKPSHSLA